MTDLKTIYVYRYNQKDGTWSERTIGNVFVSGVKNGYRLDDTMNKNSSTTIRIMSDKKADIMPEDVVMFEKANGNIPENCAVVVSVKENFAAKTIGHTKVILR